MVHFSISNINNAMLLKQLSLSIPFLSNNNILFMFENKKIIPPERTQLTLVKL